MMFDRAFWSFGPCIEAFMHCPPLLCIDATFMYGKYKEYVLIATTIDGNCHILPVAFAIVKNESADTWGWFLSFLVEIVKRRPERVALISDRHMGNKLLIAFDCIQSKNNYHWDIGNILYESFLIRIIDCI